MAAFSSESLPFVWKLYRGVAKSGENTLISPHSVSCALMLACLGAKGETEKQIRDALGMKDDSAMDSHTAFSKLNDNLRKLSEYPSGGLVVTIANKLFTRNDLPVVETYAKDSMELYKSGIESMDFGANPEGCRKTINKWVEEVTKEKIKDLLKEGALSAATRIVLANAIYFKGKWDKPFSADQTENVDFNVSSSSKVKVDMMRKKFDLYYATDEDLKLAAVSIPYQGNAVAMVIVRPNEVDGLDSLESAMSIEKLSKLIGQVRRGIKNKVDLGLPKFTFTKASNLSKVLPNLGVKDLFDASKADLSAMITDGSGVAIDDVLHEAFIEVNEEGTEAAAATAMISRMMIMPMGEVTFICDRPFLFLIADMQNETIYFIGRYSSP